MFGASRKVNTDPTIISELLSRSISTVLPSRDGLEKLLLSGKRLRVFVGADATGPDLHIGHSTNFLLLEKLRKLGHEVVVLFGDFTAMIGDPTDKSAARRALSSAEVRENIKTWRSQLSKIIRFSDGKNSARIVRNSTWLSKLSFAELVEAASNFTVQQMIERDMFDRRIKDQKPIYIHEFFYPLLQGYDSVALDVDVEIGGTDQTFNMLAGRTLQKKYHQKEKFVITTTLLENPTTGKKLMSKSEGGYISLRDAADNMFGKVMALPDGTLVQVFTDCTLLPLSEIAEIKKSLDGGTNPRDVKLRLAREIVTLYHGWVAAQKAEQQFVSTFSKSEFPIDAEVRKVKKGTPLVDAISDIVGSKSEVVRLLVEGAVFDYKTNTKITDRKMFVDKSFDLRIGKHRFVRIVVSE